MVWGAESFPFSRGRRGFLRTEKSLVSYLLTLSKSGGVFEEENLKAGNIASAKSLDSSDNSQKTRETRGFARPFPPFLVRRVFLETIALILIETEYEVDKVSYDSV